MARRFFAITLFLAWLAAIPAVKANDFTDNFVPAKIPAPVPAFTFEDAKGQILDMKNFRGHYVLLNIWATWCGPCVREMPSLDALAQKLAADTEAPEAKPITVSTGKPVTVAMPSATRMEIVPLTEDHEGLGAAEGFYKRHNLRHLKVFIDKTGETPSILRINGFPTTILINPRGMEIGRIEGATDWDDPQTVAFLENQMKSGAK